MTHSKLNFKKHKFSEFRNHTGIILDRSTNLLIDKEPFPKF